MLVMELDGRYADVMERALYNGALSGMSLDGRRFFYVNPLEVVPKACEEDDLLATSACPPEVVRLRLLSAEPGAHAGSIAGYAYSTGEYSVNVHLYIGGEV